MTDQERLARDAGELQQMLRQVRRRWRVRLLLQGLARVVLAGLGLVVITTVASRVVGSDGGLLAALRWPLLLALLAGLIAVAAYGVVVIVAFLLAMRALHGPLNNRAAPGLCALSADVGNAAARRWLLGTGFRCRCHRSGAR